MAASNATESEPVVFIDPFEIVSSCVFIPLGLGTLFIYCRILRHHVRHGFKTHYQKIFLVCATNDLVVHFSILLRIRLPTWGVHDWYSAVETGPFPLLVSFAAEFGILFQIVGTLIVAANRASSLALPHAYDKFWSARTWSVCGGGALGCLALLAASLWRRCAFARLSPGYFVPFCSADGGPAVRPGPRGRQPPPPFQAVVELLYFPACLTLVALCLLVNVFTCAMLARLSRRMGRGVNRRERAFHAVTLFQFVLQVVNTGDIIITNTQEMSEFWFFFEFAPVFNDLTSFLPIWFLLLVSEETRAIVAGRFKQSALIVTATNFSVVKPSLAK